jgi:hypothetical protein
MLCRGDMYGIMTDRKSKPEVFFGQFLVSVEGVRVVTLGRSLVVLRVNIVLF